MNLVERVKALLLTPRAEWPVIEREPGDIGHLFVNYVGYLAVIPAVAGFVGGSVVGVTVGGLGTVRTGFFSGLMFAIFSYLMTFVGVYVIAWVIDMLAPRFGGQNNFANALRVSSYFPTPFWLAGIFSILPGLSFLGILGLYGFYLLWLGLPALMKAPHDKALGYTAAVVICAVLVALVIAVVLGGLFGVSRSLL
ncbi:MAG: Yip1 family protein [Variibacter sp.]